MRHSRLEEYRPPHSLKIETFKQSGQRYNEPGRIIRSSRRETFSSQFLFHRNEPGKNIDVLEAAGYTE
jgi:hypothetical protein